MADKLEDDERCARLDKLDRLEVFQVLFCVHACACLCFRDVNKGCFGSRLQLMPN